MSPAVPRSLERGIGWLVPPASREHVLGDLAELYRSPGQYLWDALSVLPGVILGQIRRTTDPPRMLALTLVLVGMLHTRGATMMGALLPALLVLLTQVIRHAYFPCVSRVSFGVALRRALIDMGLVAGAVLLCEGLVAVWAPAWLLPAVVFKLSLPSFCVLHFVAHLQNPAGMIWPPPSARPMSADELLTEARGFRQMWLRALRIEIGAVLFLLAMSAGLIVLVSDPWVRMVGACNLVSALVVVSFMRRQLRSQNRWGGESPLDFNQARAEYREGLEQRCQVMHTYTLRYVFPLMFGPALLTLWKLLQAHRPWPVVLSTLGLGALYVLLVHWMICRAHFKLRRRLEQLATLKEKSSSELAASSVCLH